MPMPCSPEITPPSARANFMMRATASLASLQHLVVVGVDRDVGVHVAVARVHVQRDEHAAAQDFAWIASHCGHQRLEVAAGEDLAQRLASSAFHETRIAWLCRSPKCRRRGARADPASARAHPPPMRAHPRAPPPSCSVARPRFAARPPQMLGIRLREERREAIRELQLVADRELDVDALDAVGVVAEALERDHHVLVDLERVGVLRDRGGARAVEPEALALLGGHRDEALAVARVGDAHHVRGGLRDRGVSSSLTMSPIRIMRGRPRLFALVA